ncbi:beta strand repeat-containing protein [Sphingomonas faeni]|uniref:beta strand repeat-containing protein n=1 Tax=Sphingomonas faeni TaxID=185950 RepID=UPI0033597932
MPAISNGTIYQANTGSVSSALSNSIQQSILNVIAQHDRILGSKYRVKYNSVLKDIDKQIDTWLSRHSKTDPGYNRSNNSTFIDGLGVPFAKNGNVVVVIASEYADPVGNLTRDVNGQKVRYKKLDSEAEYDAYYNRIVILPWFANALSNGNVEYLSSTGWKKYTLDDVIHHEFGHAADESLPNGRPTRESAATVRDQAYNDGAELAEYFAQQTDGRGVRLPHGRLRFRDENGDVIDPQNGADLKRFSDLQHRLGLDPSASGKVIKDADGNFYVVDDDTGQATRLSDIYGGVGRIIGSSLANYLFHDSGVIADIATSTVLGSIGQALGNVVGLAGSNVDLSTSFDAAFSDFDQTLYSNLKATGIGALSSYTTMELGRAFGLHGFGAELFNQVAGSAVNPIYNEVLNNIFSGQAAFDHFSLSSVFGPNASFDSVFGPSIGSFFGAQLGSLVISPTTSAGAVLSSIGSSVGAFIAGKVLSSLGNVIAPGVGAFVGFVLGTLIGNLFGHHKPRIPSASAETTLLLPFARYGLGATLSANGGDLGFATTMAEAARDTLNGIIAQIVGTSGTAYVANAYSPTQSYGYAGQQVYVKLGGSQINVTSADQAVSKGVLWALPQTQVIGGDLFLKRAIAGVAHADITTLLGDLQVAADYGNYLRNRSVINEMIQNDPQSAFSASWIVTLGRAVEIGVTTFKPSDFYGGMQGFLNSFGVSASGSRVSYEDLTLNLSGGTLSITGNSANSANLFSLIPQSSVDGANLNIASFGAQVGYVEQSVGIRSTGSDIEIAAPGSGSVTVYAGTPGYASGYYGYYSGNDGGSDIIVGGNANDYLAAGSGGDWIDGQAGDDQIFGGAGANVLLGGDGNDQIIGGSGREYLAGGAGDDYIDGGSGADVLIGGSGSDSLLGGDGNDILITDEDGGSTYDVLNGGNGNDTVSFERFSTGVTADISAQGPSNVLTTVQAGYTFYRNQAIYSPDGQYRFTFQNDQNIVLYGPGNAVLWTSNTRNDGADRLALNADGNLVLYRGNSIKWQSYSGGHSGATLTIDNGGQININDQDGTAYWTVGGGGYVAPVISNVYGDQWASIENISGSNYDDHLTGTNFGSTLKGLAGNDVLTGGGGDDTLEGGGGADQMNGGGGVNTASYASSTEGVYVDFAGELAVGGDATEDAFANIQNLSGSDYGDELAGDVNGNVIKSGAGDDRIGATSGADSYDGGEGFDTVDYSATSFVSGTSTYEYGGSSYTYTAPAITVYMNEYASSVSYFDVDGSSGYQTLLSVEQIVGTASDDSFSSLGSLLDVTWNGGAGADTFAGGDGSDTYVFGHSFGTYAISDTSAASNTLRLTSDISFDDIWVGNAGGTLQVGIRGEAGYMSVSSNFATVGNNVIKTLEMGGAGHVDLTQITAVYAGSDGGEGLSGDSSTSNLIFGYNGADSIYGANGSYSYQGSVIYAGLGDDTIVTSVGDDQFLYERGNGRDYVIDNGGQNTIVFGSTVAADDVLYEVIGNDLIIGVKNPDNPNLTASQVTDTMQIVGGGVKYVGTTNGTTYWNTNFSIEAGGATTDLTKANIAWTINYFDDSTPPGGYGGYGGYGGGYIPPIVLDLSNDGLEITPVAQSDIVTRDASGNVLRTSWVGPTNGILAYDRNGDGRVDNTGDISFRHDKAGAKTDLEGLAGWDGNADGALDARDTDFAKLVVWTDINQDGQQEIGEVVSLLEVGVASIDLKGKPTGFDGKDSIDTIVHNTTLFTRIDGSTGTAYDVALARRALGDDAASSILGMKGLGEVASFGRLANGQSTSTLGKGVTTAALIGGAVDALPQVQVGGLVNAAIDPASAARWANVLDPTLKAARQNLLAHGMQGGDLLQTIRTSVAHGDDWTTLFGRSLRTTATRMQAVVVDFDRSGADLMDPTKSTALADVSRTGVPVQIGWVKGTDGVLAYDADGNGQVDVAKEVDFTGKVANAKSAFQGMGAYDTNKDGLLDAADAGFANFLIWRDKNANGRSDVGEIQSLAQAGVKQFDLAHQSSRSAFGSANANEVLGVGKVTFTDGSSRATYDVALGFADGDTNADPAPTRTPAAQTTIIRATPSGSGNEAKPNGPASSSDLSTSAELAVVGRMRGGLSGQSGQVVAADAATTTASQWWRDPTAVGQDLASLASPQLVGSGRSGANASSLAGTPSGDASQLQRLMLLRQNMAAMHGDAGGAAAIWNRGAANDMPLAAASTSGYATVPASSLTARAG